MALAVHTLILISELKIRIMHPPRAFIIPVMVVIARITSELANPASLSLTLLYLGLLSGVVFRIPSLTTTTS